MGSKGQADTYFEIDLSTIDAEYAAFLPLVFSADETCDVGNDTGTPVTDDLHAGETAFTGRVKWVQIDLGADAQDADHLISASERYRIAMARQ